MFCAFVGAMGGVVYVIMRVSVVVDGSVSVGGCGGGNE